MRKILITFLSVLIALLVCQTAFAKGNIGITLSYNRKSFTVDHPYTLESITYTLKKDLLENGFNLGLFGEYYVSNNFSLAGKFNVSFFSGEMIGSIWYQGNHLFDVTPINNKYIQIDFNLFGKYNVFEFNTFNGGIQAGLMDSFVKWNSNETANVFMLALGAYTNLKITNKLNIYTDFKFPLAFFVKYGEGYDDKGGFLKEFLYDISLGLRYDITSNINIGLKFNINNANLDGVISGIDGKKEGYNTRFFAFSIGSQLCYSF